MILLDLLLAVGTRLSTVASESLTFASNRSELQKTLKRLEVDLSDLRCAACNKKINPDLSNLNSIYKEDGQISAYCDDPKCGLYAGYGKIK